MTSLFKFLDIASKEYYEGTPIISDEQFDYLADLCGYTKIGAKTHGEKSRHTYPLYSLQKYFVGEGKVPLETYTKPKINSPKLDGAAISLLYVRGYLVQALTRGDGEEGQIITDKFLANPTPLVPVKIACWDTIQVSGEVVAPFGVTNARNYAAGALNLKDIEEFRGRDLTFIAYGVSPSLNEFYDSDLKMLESLGFKTVLDEAFCESFPHDGRVVRINSNKDFNELGYTSSHPRGAYAIKERKEGITTTLLDVIWQTGKTGRVTPVAILDPITIDGAIISKATLNNPGFIKALNIDIGDKVEVIRAGDIIPTIVRKVVVNSELSQDKKQKFDLE